MTWVNNFANASLTPCHTALYLLPTLFCTLLHLIYSVRIEVKNYDVLAPELFQMIFCSMERRRTMIFFKRRYRTRKIIVM